MNQAHRLAYQTLSGYQFKEASAIEVLSMEISNDILCAACSLGYTGDSIVGVSSQIVKIWRIFGVRYWAFDTLDYVMKIFVLQNSTLENEYKDYAASLGAFSAAIFCLDRAVVHARRQHGVTSANWFRCAQELSHFQLSGSYNLQVLMAKTGAEARLANDPRQKEKAFIFECWQAWQKSPHTYTTKAAFAKDMIAKCEHLKSQKKVEDWCRVWEKANPTG